MGDGESGVGHLPRVELDEARSGRRRQHMTVPDVLDRTVAVDDSGPHAAGAHVDDEDTHCGALLLRRRPAWRALTRMAT